MIGSHSVAAISEKKQLSKQVHDWFVKLYNIFKCYCYEN